MRHVLAVLVSLLIFATPAAASDVAATFDRAEIWIHPPGMPFCNGRLDDRPITRALESLPADVKLPTVVLMHGCSYRKGAAWMYARWLTRQGYAVIIPDSFQRTGRPETCDPWTWRPLADAPQDQVFAMRGEELAYAIERVREIPWVDTRNLFLMGDDEGGDVVAAYDGDDFNAVVITGAACRRGYRVSSGTPAMAIVSAEDPMLAGLPAESCENAATAAGRTLNSLIVPGFWHDVSGVKDARPLLVEFLARHRVP